MWGSEQHKALIGPPSAQRPLRKANARAFQTRATRERKEARDGKCEGRKKWAELDPLLVNEAGRLRRRSPKGHQRSLRVVATELAKRGYLNQRGVTFLAASIVSMPRRSK
jgi:hypothetical protein